MGKLSAVVMNMKYEDPNMEAYWNIVRVISVAYPHILPSILSTILSAAVRSDGVVIFMLS